jgi:hypothetical protein
MSLHNPFNLNIGVPLPDFDPLPEDYDGRGELPDSCCPVCMHDCYGEKPERICYECEWSEKEYPNPDDYPLDVTK